MRKQALNDKDISESIEDMLDDYIDDELSRMEEMDPQHWDWDNIKQNFSSHLLVDISLESVQGANKNKDVTTEDIRNFALTKAKEVYNARKALLPDDVMLGLKNLYLLEQLMKNGKIIFMQWIN
ncbi:MAG: hypothetical protein CM1200mP1_16350 [Candidatus Neomarinimicrobiota bacterium]|nr:MAG: hypothetical protein CM1200mP1_16350 [Candidatus Neomarinimicrobiota bacterium]